VTCGNERRAMLARPSDRAPCCGVRWRDVSMSMVRRHRRYYDTVTVSERLLPAPSCVNQTCSRPAGSRTV
jgi:hypothetical protein